MRERGGYFPCKLFLAVNLRGIFYLFLFAFLPQCDGVLMAGMIADLVPLQLRFSPVIRPGKFGDNDKESPAQMALV